MPVVSKLESTDDGCCNSVHLPKTYSHNSFSPHTAPHTVDDCNAKVQRLIDMGIAETEARNSLSKHNWDLEKTTEYLFS